MSTKNYEFKGKICFFLFCFFMNNSILLKKFTFKNILYCKRAAYFSHRSHLIFTLPHILVKNKNNFLSLHDAFSVSSVRSFKAVADKVHRGLRVYLKLFMERAELLYQHVLILYGIADDLSNFHHRAKIANITGGTTTAVGGAAVITGLALIPVTFGVSIIISAIGLGIATAGGITAASASISDTINNMHVRMSSADMHPINYN